MKTTTKLINLIIVLALFSNCAKDNCDDSTKNLFVDKTYLPYIIPYSDTSTRLFLKNGKDTLLFKSQGLKETIEVQKGNDENDCRTYNLQKFSLTMTASDTDFFELKLFVMINSSLSYGSINLNNKYLIKNLYADYFINYYPPVIKINVLDNIYDTVNVVTMAPNCNIYTKPNLGIIKIETSNSKYELIK